VTAGGHMTLPNRVRERLTDRLAAPADAAIYGGYGHSDGDGAPPALYETDLHGTPQV